MIFASLRPLGQIAACVSAVLLGTAAYAQDKQVVRFLHNETDPPSIEFFNKAIAEFEAANPDIDVQMEAVSTDGRLQKVLASINTRTMPEVFKLLPEERFEFARRGYLVPLDDLVAEIGVDEYVPGALTRVDGKLYDVPYTLGNFSVQWYRKDLLDAAGIEPPTNWDELKAAAETLTKDSTTGFVFPAGQNRMTSIYLAEMLWSAGGTFFDKDLNVAFDTPETVEALTFLKEMAGYAPQGIGSYSYGDMINTYLTGTVAIDIYAPRLIANAAANRPDLFEKTAGAPMPAGPSGVGVKFVNANSFALASPEVGAKNTEAGRKFLEFIVTGERLRDFSLTAFPHLIPPLKSVQDEVIEAGAPLLDGREDLARLAFDTSNSLDFDSEAGAVIEAGEVKRSGVINPYIGSIIARGIPALVVQQVVLEGADPAEAAAWGQEEMEAIVEDLK